MNKYVLFLLFFSKGVFAQILPLGFYEGLMGNSGVAISDSTAASYYNPSLLNSKTKNAFSLSGNAYSNYVSTSPEGKLSSAKLTPTYLSSVQVFENYRHEFFVANILSVQGRVTGTVNEIEMDKNVQRDGYYAGYTFAFKDFPFGFQVGFRLLDVNAFGFAQGQTSASAQTIKITSQKRRAELLLGVGGHHTFDGYTLGYRYLSRSAKIYEKREGKMKTFLYENNNTYKMSEAEYDDDASIAQGENVLIGHGFKIGAHEFLLDSQFAEEADLTRTYTWTQSFGYKATSANQHQFMCGISHRISKDVTYFGQSAYYSTGYSWQSDASRSAVGLYYLSNKIEQDDYSYGLTFSSEFTY